MKKISYVLLSVLCIISLNGCGLIPEVELTEEETKLVAEYAAGLLLKYDAQHHNGLMEITDEPILVETPEPVPGAAPEVDTEGGDTEQAGTGSDVSELIAAPELADAIGIPDFQVTYTGYETCDFYPEQESDDMVFSMQAQEGHDLLVLHFDLMNPSDAPQECDVVTNAPLFRAIVNDDIRLNAQTTILLNDLSVYKDTIDANTAVDTVVVFEIEESTTAELNTISLLILDEENDYSYQLQ